MGVAAMTLSGGELSGPGWIHEIRHNGFRILAQRRGRRLADRFPIGANTLDLAILIAGNTC